LHDEYKEITVQYCQSMKRRPLEKKKKKKKKEAAKLHFHTAFGTPPDVPPDVVKSAH